MMNTPRYWRVYYKIQELLQKEFENYYVPKGAVGGVREQSTLPVELNNEARRVAEYLMNIHPEQTKVEEFNNMIVITNSEVYHTYLNELSDDLRAFVDHYVLADNYFLSIEMSSQKVLGGFGIRKDGTLCGLFSLEKGMGTDLLQKQIKIVTKQSDSDMLKLNCIGDFLRSFYEKQGFRVFQYARWDERLAQEKFNTERFGFPNIYWMVKTK